MFLNFFAINHDYLTLLVTSAAISRLVCKMRQRLKRHWATFLIMAVQTAGIVLFAHSFFSVEDKMLSSVESTRLRNSAIKPETMHQFSQVEGHCQSLVGYKVADKMVLMVVDALRADFISSIANSSLSKSCNLSMPFVESLIQDRKAVGLVSQAQTPTVTLPRIKAILSGTFPSFMDIVKNLNAPRFGDDNFLDQLFVRGDRILFFGDETWLSMFPRQYFLRSNGTSSFFATDYTSVDDNVTQNLIPELSLLSEWDVMILHYLGVDHIGHSHGGASSRVMPAKLKEMDAVVKKIYSHISKSEDSYLFVLTGDHGMTDAGNHGGSSSEESDTAVVFLKTPQTMHSNKSPFKQSKRMLQVDLAATISSLLGLAIPEKSKGLLSIPVLKDLGVSSDHLLCLLFNNSVHLQRMMSDAVQSQMSFFEKAISSHFEYISSKETSHSPTQSLKTSSTTAAKFYHIYSSRVQKAIMSEKSSKTSIFSLLTLSVIVSFVSFLLVFMIECSHSTSSNSTQLSRLRRPSKPSPPTTYSIVMSILSSEEPDWIGFVFLMHFVLHGLCLSSTSFIEMENYYWHFMSSSLVLYHFVFALLRKMYIRQRNISVSQEHLHNPEICSDSDAMSCNSRNDLEGETTAASINLHSSLAQEGLNCKISQRKAKKKSTTTDVQGNCSTNSSSTLETRKGNKRVVSIPVFTAVIQDNDRRKTRRRRGQNARQEDSVEDDMLSYSALERELEEETRNDDANKESSKNVVGSKRIERLYTDYFFLARPVIYLLVLLIMRVISCWTTVENEATLVKTNDERSSFSSWKDIRSYLESEEQKHLLSCLVILTFFSLTFLTPSTRLGKQHCLLGSGFFWIYLFRSDCHGSNRVLGFNTKILSEVGLDFSLSSNTKARLVYIHVFAIILDAMAQRLKLDTNWLYLDDFIKKYTDEVASSSVSYRDQIKKLSCLRILSTCLVLVSCLVLRVEFIPLFGLNILVEKLLYHCVVQESSSKKVVHHLIIMYVTLAFSSFYSQGNSNSISSIDTSSGYIGLESFNLILVSLLVILSTYAGFLYWMLMLFVRVQESKSLVHAKLKERQMMSLLHLILLQRYWVTGFFEVVSILLQDHLFIWSVVSPKFMYEAFLTILSHVFLSIIFLLHLIDQ